MVALLICIVSYYALVSVCELRIILRPQTQSINGSSASATVGIYTGRITKAAKTNEIRCVLVGVAAPAPTKILCVNEREGWGGSGRNKTNDEYLPKMKVNE